MQRDKMVGFGIENCPRSEAWDVDGKRRGAVIGATRGEGCKKKSTKERKMSSTFKKTGHNKRKAKLRPIKEVRTTSLKAGSSSVRNKNSTPGT